MSYKSAAKSYQLAHQNGGNPSETEGRALLEAARRMAEAQNDSADPEGMRTAARLNWRLWTIFQAEIAKSDCPLPTKIRTNMLNLCNFVDKRMVEILANPNPQMLDVLININQQIAAGLLANPNQEGGSHGDDQVTQSSTSDTSDLLV